MVTYLQDQTLSCKPQAKILYNTEVCTRKHIYKSTSCKFLDDHTGNVASLCYQEHKVNQGSYQDTVFKDFAFVLHWES